MASKISSSHSGAILIISSPIHMSKISPNNNKASESEDASYVNLLKASNVA
ncbi:MAG: hypothetical protein IXK25_00670 [Candidatus Kinetoplastibacterium crithidii]|nr:hypothetical protein [Candidatus Kinetoplastibacterium crithidii]